MPGKWVELYMLHLPDGCTPPDGTYTYTDWNGYSTDYISDPGQAETLKLHIAAADRDGHINKVGTFLRSLEEDDWHHHLDLELPAVMRYDLAAYDHFKPEGWDYSGTYAQHGLNSIDSYYQRVHERTSSEAAIQNYVEAAERGDANAMFNIGKHFVTAYKPKDDDEWPWPESAVASEADWVYEVAEYWLYRSALSKCTEAITLLIKLYEHMSWTDALWHVGLGHESVQSIIRKWLTKASELGDAQSMIELAYFLSRLEGNNADEWALWLLRAAELGELEAVEDLCEGNPFVIAGVTSTQGYEWHKYLSNLSDDLMSKIIPWLHKAFALNSANIDLYGAAMQLAECHANGLGNLDRDLNEAFNWYKKAAEYREGSPSWHKGEDVLYKLGNCYAQGLGVERDLNKSIQLYLSAANIGSRDAMAQLSQAYEYGLGVDIDKGQSLHWKNRLNESQ